MSAHNPLLRIRVRRSTGNHEISVATIGARTMMRKSHDHDCENLACGKTVATQHKLYCRSCAAKRRKRPRKTFCQWVRWLLKRVSA